MMDTHIVPQIEYRFVAALVGLRDTAGRVEQQARRVRVAAVCCEVKWTIPELYKYRDIDSLCKASFRDC